MKIFSVRTYYINVIFCSFSCILVGQQVSWDLWFSVVKYLTDFILNIKQFIWKTLKRTNAVLGPGNLDSNELPKKI